MDHFTRVCNWFARLYSVATEVRSSTNTSSPTTVIPIENKSTALTQPTPQSKEQISKIVSSYISEEKEKSKTRLKLIVHNTVESTSEDCETRCKYDVESVECIFDKHLAVPVKVTKAICLG